MHPDSIRARPSWSDVIPFGLAGGLIAFTLYRLTFQLQYHWDWSAIPHYILRWDTAAAMWVPNILLSGLFNTIRLTVWGGLLALLVGTAIGCARVSRPLFFRLCGRAYVETVRNIPELVFIFIFYFFVASQLMPYLGIDRAVAQATPAQKTILAGLFGDPGLFTSFLPGAIALGLFEAAAVGEIVRAGIQAVPKGQPEAAFALGIGRILTMWKIVLPQAWQRVLPPLAGELISLVKSSSLVAIISVPELSFAGSQVAGATRGMFEAWFSVGGIYFLVCFTLSMLFARLERRALTRRLG